MRAESIRKETDIALNLYSATQALPPGQPEETTVTMRITISETDTTTGIQNYSHMFGIDGYQKNAATLREVFSIRSRDEQRGNYLFGDRGVISQTCKYFRLVLNKSADLIQMLMTAVKQLFVRNRQLEAQLFNQSQEFRAQLNAKEMENIQLQAEAFQAREYAKQADLIFRNMSDANAQIKEAAETCRGKEHA